MENLRLERRPEARAFSVETLLQHVRDGKVRIPDFQRPLRWRSTHVIDLFDSVYRGFPVGDLLLFKRQADAARIHVGPVDIQAPAVPEAYFVVDGQQRITALAGAMLHPEQRPRDDTHAVWFDLESETFLCAQSVEQPPHWIPVNAVGDSFALLSWLNEWPFRAQRPDLVQKAIALGKALREYSIPAYIVEGASDAVLRLIFKRVNRSGMPMREAEVFEALHRTGEAHPLESACARLENKTGFGVIADDFLRGFEVIEGLAPWSMTSERESDTSALPIEAIERAERAMFRTVQFLSDDAGIIHRKLLPYVLPQIVLSRFFDVHPRPSIRTRALLVRWVWRGALSSCHANSRDTSISRLSSLIDQNEFTSAERLLETVPKQVTFPAASTPWNGRTATSHICAIALAHLAPRDVETGDVLRSNEIRALLARRAIGRVFLDVQGEDAPTVATRVLLPSRRQLWKLASAPAPVLASHGIDEDAAAALARGNFAAFAGRRASTLDGWFHRFFTDRCAPDESDRPPVAELIRRVNNEFVSP